MRAILQHHAHLAFLSVPWRKCLSSLWLQMAPNAGKLSVALETRSTVHTYLINLEEQVNRKCKKFSKDKCKCCPSHEAPAQGHRQVPVWVGTTYKIPAKSLVGLVCCALFLIPIATSKFTKLKTRSTSAVWWLMKRFNIYCADWWTDSTSPLTSVKIQHEIFVATDNIVDFSSLGINFTAESTNTPSGRIWKKIQILWFV